MPDPDALSNRQVEVLEATVAAWCGSDAPLRAPVGGASSQTGWPSEAPLPTRDELRPLIEAGWLTADSSQAPDWVLTPSEATRDEFGDPIPPEVTEALGNPEQRLGLILEALVAAYGTGPRLPVVLTSYDRVDMVMTSGWDLLQPDTANREDFRLLAQVGLAEVCTIERPGRDAADGTPDIEVVPTATGQQVVGDAGAALQALIEVERDPERQQRLIATRKRIAELLRSASPGTTTGSIVRALT